MPVPRACVDESTSSRPLAELLAEAGEEARRQRARAATLTRELDRRRTAERKQSSARKVGATASSHPLGVPRAGVALPAATSAASLRDSVSVVAAAVVAVLLINHLLLQIFVIPSTSMEPTLEVGDRVVVEKLGPRLGSPLPGDVVVFQRQLGKGSGAGGGASSLVDALKRVLGLPRDDVQILCKRVVAVAGERVQARRGRVLVNGRRLEDVDFTGGVPTSSFGPVEVPAGSVFVLGDNRPDSRDSRAFGAVPVRSILGRAFLRVWPLDEVQGL
jgi:signal peptidase I